MDIKIDASLSYDEGVIKANPDVENNISFFWQCPTILESICQSNYSSVLTINYSSYGNLIAEPKIETEYPITLFIQKDIRQGTKKFVFNLKNKDFLRNEDDFFLNSIIINKLTRGNSYEILFKVEFLDKRYDMFKFAYYWTVKHFISESQYLNGREEFLLKVLNNDMLIGKSEIILQIKSKETNALYLKTYYNEKNKPPYGGSCLVIPSVGISLETEFQFNLNDWIGSSYPLFYKIKYLNSNQIYVDISNGGFGTTIWKSSYLPSSNHFIVEAIDNSGLSTIFPCNLKVKSNQNFNSLDYYFRNEWSPNLRLLLIEIYKTQNRPSFASLAFNDQALDTLEYYLKNSDKQRILQDFDNIMSMVLDVSSNNFSKKKLPILNTSLQTIVQNINPSIQSTDKVQMLYNAVDNIFNKISTLEEFKSDKTILTDMEKIVTSLNDKIFENMIDGERILILNSNYDIQMNKVSIINPMDICFDYNSKTRILNNVISNKNKNSKLMRKLNSNCPFSDSPAINIPSNNVTSILSNTSKTSLGFQGQLNKNIDLNINSTQFSNSLDFGLSVGNSQEKKFKKLSAEDIIINFEVRLKMPENADNSNIVDATCVQYTKSKPDISCSSWYDVETKEVICVCNKQGLTVNVLDKSLSFISKLAQFPGLTTGLSNKLYKVFSIIKC